jgi:hypothetical protein
LIHSVFRDWTLPAMESFTFFSGTDTLSPVEILNYTKRRDDEIIITLFYPYD